MSVRTLWSIAGLHPENLLIVVMVDGRYAMTGGQRIEAPVTFAEAAAEPDQVGSAGHLGNEGVVDRVLDDRPAAGRADLAGMQEGSGQGVIDNGLEIGVGEDDVRTLAAELQGDLLHVAGRRPHDRAPGYPAAGERHQVDVATLGQRGTDPLARPQ